MMKDENFATDKFSVCVWQNELMDLNSSNDVSTSCSEMKFKLDYARNYGKSVGE